ncbi:hypothetical protein [Streptomyces sp. NPDC046860]|uniref:hypothetical protein n=1 Tax=Streptomyces sp. NPDC046860 TaxID=3154495 RepID=UPI0033C1B45D
MKGRIALSAATGLVVIGSMSANAGHGGAGGPDNGVSTSAGSGSVQVPDGSGRVSGDAEPDAVKAPLSGNGTFRVGSDIEPGTYRSTGGARRSCRWERTANAGNGLGSVIADAEVTGTAVVTIRSTDAYFRSSGCGGWTRTG